MDRGRLIAQLKIDEGFTPKAKWDVKQYSYGYGCRAPHKDATITEPEAARYLEEKTSEAIGYFHEIFKGHEHKFNDVRAEAFINMIFNMGAGSTRNPKKGGMRSFVNTLRLIFDYEAPCWKSVAANLRASKWFRQTGDRAERICREIATGEKG
jgi:hypothetical protein